ncbi:hypothetical protein FGSG_08118 [Fusarium graminearum PH-1]|uniref:Chromosome 2, complete genome n=1 Tax=Gibberella zeae (strain ATCC MYA-4620 / CBS 123657 / FGSC 9075 / NRRL 31084 / PH-1) TaxID=229533 RepID=I1RV56_GIBZE|nr:hypothetical protein FGSG_08118 [Fusarium graminearum PH-1]ESU15275.1 hypothetical protein FGSG_08118 [Fusarium graminearum PH-1]KAI6753650.1 hypothetical protein HG531_005819 [Fusarium graminearum]CAF3489078.1 unnamed protein product [Fusarium graminearum]CEF76379.1 unnamed protein product [Fusarium graminearum]|eukprot:XP_011320700.1 hypothetical protein FGSG_08118 [Fusarium graminearum PH-1]
MFDQSPTPSSGGPVCIYIDDSNVAIRGRAMHDPQGTLTPWNYDIDVLANIIIQQFDLTAIEPFVQKSLNFYGADLHRSPQLDHLRGLGLVYGCDCPRNGHGHEKQADVALATDMTEQAKHALDFGIARDFVLVSGDSDFIPAVRKVLGYGFNVHVWAWRRSLSSEFYRLKQDFEDNCVPGLGQMRVHFLESHLHQLTRSPESDAML